MAERKIIFWEVDTQADFMLPGGKLYVAGAEKIIPNIERLLEAARATHTLVVSSRCAHTMDDPEFQTFPPHCIRGTPGAEIIPQGMLKNVRIIQNDPEASPESLDRDILGASQVVIEKQVLDVFSNPRAGELVERLGADAEYMVFGVVTEYCVQLAVKGLLGRGRKVAMVIDAIETLDAETGRRCANELRAMGAGSISTSEAIAEVTASGGEKRAGR